MKINSYINQLKGQKLNEGTIYNTNRILRKLNEFKPIEQITKDDLIRFFTAFQGTDNYLLLHQNIIKKFFKDTGKPEIVDWVKYVKPKETLKSDDILTPDDINKMINATESHYWKALISFLFETGCRISEARKIRYKDCIDTDHGMIVNIPTSKTSAGYRKVILPFSSQYIRNLKTFINAKGDDIIFHIKNTHTHEMLEKIAKDAGVNKSASPHKFRHAQATDLVRRGYQEAIIRKKLGWSPTSPMIARYQHLNDEDVINATLDNTGKLPITATPMTEIKEAERLSLVDAAMQFSKLSEDNESLKEQLKEQEKRQNDLKAIVMKLVNAKTEKEIEPRLKDIEESERMMKEISKLWDKAPEDIKLKYMAKYHSEEHIT